MGEEGEGEGEGRRESRVQSKGERRIRRSGDGFIDEQVPGMCRVEDYRTIR